MASRMRRPCTEQCGSYPNGLHAGAVHFLQHNGFGFSRSHFFFCCAIGGAFASCRRRCDFRAHPANNIRNMLRLVNVSTANNIADARDAVLQCGEETEWPTLALARTPRREKKKKEVNTDIPQIMVCVCVGCVMLGMGFGDWLVDIS